MLTIKKEDPTLLELKDLSCTVFVSSRMEKLEGFRSFPAPGKSALGLIFRDNYERTLTMEERESLNQLLESRYFQHPLTLRLLGKAAGEKLWTLEELESELETAWVETTGDAGLRDMYRRLYQLSGTSEPADSWYVSLRSCLIARYPLPLRECFFEGFLKKEEFLEEELKKLSALGWLKTQQTGYRMHPVIAESIRMKAPAEEGFLPFWERAEKCFFDGSGERQRIRSWKRSPG
ncbi:MAG: hypothetical protein V8S22_10590 [Lachnospiraceae bacterium]